MRCCQLHKVACFIQLLTKAYSQSAYGCRKGILLYLELFVYSQAVQIITLRIVVLAVYSAYSKFNARIYIEAIAAFKALAIFCTQACCPVLVVAVQLMPAVVVNLELVFQTTALQN